MQSDQLSPIGADMTSATSLSLSIYNLLLYGADSRASTSINLLICYFLRTGTWPAGGSCPGYRGRGEGWR